MRSAVPSLPALCAILALSGCATLPTGRGWGEDATAWPGWERLSASAANAARDPWVWGPLAGAALMQIDDWDRRTAYWAREHTPVFGSQKNAEDWSDDLRRACVLVHYGTILAAPSGSQAGDWLVNKVQGTLVNVAAVSATGAITRTLKTSIDRRRPNDFAGESFPSGHTSSAAVHTRLASRNLEATQIPDPAQTAFNVGLHALTIGTSWARIEAGWHFPSDTLFSMALGHFLGAFFNDAFLGLDSERAAIALRASDGGALLEWRVQF